ncbi:helix-turn-helix domain-containing protein [Paraburkholderia bannensis]|uniref:helix-turn-helix domain-containing protein n=1 Tax=Paraburkholderia bannensis TaxID=765414 RepID=UPI002AB70113|nr:helix-turn-helix transcriptional regulator [Paraburkholderia bannensis]
MELAKVFGGVLREYRLRANLTQEQLAFEADIRRTYVSMLELGQHQPTLTMLFVVAAALKCAPSELLAEVETRMQSTARKAAPKKVNRGAKSPRKNDKSSHES